MSKNDDATIEERISELEQLVAWFDSDDFILEKALDKYQQAEKLATEIQRDITQLKNTIEQVGGVVDAK